MKKIFGLGLILVSIFIIYLAIRPNNVEFDRLNYEDLDDEIIKVFETQLTSSEFGIYTDETTTIILFKPKEVKTGEYVTTSINVKKKKDKFIVTGVVESAVNDPYVSYMSIVRINQVMKINNIEFKREY